MQIQFSHKIELTELNVDDTLFISILSNALDNALNAQEFIPENERYIKLMMKTVDDKLLLSVKNPTHQKVIFSDGLPVTEKKGHGYGTQSIRYMTERLGGNCQFSEQDRIFTLRVII
jgi:sensor histidine kinase regulating citrate/malate metabolism